MSDLRATVEGGVIRIPGAGLPALLAVVPVDALALGPDLVPTAGRWVRDAGEDPGTSVGAGTGVGTGTGAVLFTPRFPVVAGSELAVVGRMDARQPWRELARVSVPSPRLERSTVALRIDPGSAEVPANLLRVTVTFSGPMEEGSAAGGISLVDSRGDELVGAVLGMPPELWDRERRRLTVLLEPGRIKRGLQPNVQAGPPLVEGDTVTVVVDDRLRDASGAALAAGARRTYRVGAPIRSRVDPALWAVRWPADASAAAVGAELLVRFDRPLDRALVRRCLVATDGQGHPVPGRAALDEDARVWTFAAAPGHLPVALRVDTRLEDLAGNSVRRVFDRDLRLVADAHIEPGTLTLTPDGPLTRAP